MATRSLLPGVLMGFVLSIFTVFNNLQEQSFNLIVEGEPKNVVVDPNNWILKASPTVVDPNAADIPLNGYVLKQNYPNPYPTPFNPNTKITYNIPEGGFVSLKIFDILGNEITTLVSEYQTADTYVIEFNGIDGRKNATLSSGVYIYQLKVNNLPAGKAGFTESKKMILIK